MLENRTTRLVSAIGEDKMALLRDKCVCVIGLGGVGGYALEAISRCFINKLIIMDFDRVNITNINRQLIANDDTIGLYKTDCFEKRIKKINPDCEIIKLTKPYNEETKIELFNYKIDFIIDAFDDVKGKIDLAYECKNRGINLISSMGMANRFDPSKIEITTLDKTFNDPLARALRSKIKFKLKVVSSTETPIKSDTLASVSYVPSVAGLLMASYVINKLKEEN